MSPPAPSAANIDVGAINAGDRAAFIVVAEVWLDRMHDAAQNVVGSADAAAEVCSGVLGLLWEHHAVVTAGDLSRESLLLATRRRALAHLERHGWTPPGDHSGAPQDEFVVSATRGSTVANRVVLAHAAAAVIGANGVSAIDLNHRHGVDAAALADTLNVPRDAALQRLATLRGELDKALAAFVLWNEGRPVCHDLDQSLDGSMQFDRDAFDGIGRHRATCDTCARAHRALVNPASMFLAAPVIALSPSIRHRVLAAIDDRVEDLPTAVAPVVSPLVATGAALVLSPRDDGLDLDLTDLWDSTAAVEPATTTVAPATSSVAAVVPMRGPSQRRRLAAYVAGGTAAAVLMGGAVLALTGSGDDGRTVLDPPALDVEEPEVRSLGPVPPTVASDTTGESTSTTDSTSTTVPETTSTVPESTVDAPTEPPPRQPAPPATTRTSVATGTPPVPTAPTTTAPTVTTPPATTAAPTPTPTPTTGTTQPPVTVAPTTAAPTTAPPTTAPPTTAAPTTAAPTTEPPTTAG